MSLRLIKVAIIRYKSLGFRGFLKRASTYLLRRCQTLLQTLPLISGCYTRYLTHRLVMNRKPLKLHLGCGSVHLHGYVNIDKFNRSANLVMDAGKLHFPDNSVDEVFTSHMVEHMAYPEFMKALAEWERVLRREGTLIIRCPNFEKHLSNWLNADYQKRFGENNYGVNIILGFQDRGPGHVNRNVFTSERLEDLVGRFGFEIIECHPVMNRYGDMPDGDILLRARKRKEQ